MAKCKFDNRASTTPRNMKLASLVIIGFLAVSTNAAGGFALAESSATAEASVEVASSKQTEDAAPEEIAVTTETNTAVTDVTKRETDSTPELASEDSALGAQTSALDLIPYPMNIVLRTFGKDVLRKLDVESVCDTVQLVDWKKYQKLLEMEDFAGFKDKISHDVIITSTAEAFQEAVSNYINKMADTLKKTIKIDNLDVIENNLQNVIGIISTTLGVQKDKGSELQKNINNLVGNITVDKKAQKEALENLQKNINKMLEMIQTAATNNNSLKVSNMTDILGKGSSADYV